MSSLPKLKAWLPSSARYWLIHLWKNKSTLKPCRRILVYMSKSNLKAYFRTVIAHGCKLVPLALRVSSHTLQYYVAL